MVKLNKYEIAKKIENDEPISITFKFINERFLMILNGILAKFLSKIDHMFLLNSLIMILREIIVNALKSNVKRVYFKKIGLNVNSADDYKKGMVKFRNEIIGDFNIIEQDINESNYYINLKIDMRENDLLIQVVNNAALLPDELSRITFRVAKAQEYNDFTEAYGEIEDATEGAGLGIVLAILLLKNMGINAKSFNIRSNGKITTTTLTIPHELRPKQIISDITDKIINEIEGIPTFPEHILRLQQMCNDPESSIDKISQTIMTDPALSADVIKLSNSAGFFPGKRIENINTAVMTIGLKNLDVILLASNARRILDQRYNKFEQIWEHCNKTAFYARRIALHYGMTKIIEYVFMAGLLHDLGKIVLLATDMSLVKRIATLVENRKIITSTIMEEISIGISHSTIGELIAKKWNFPDYLVTAVKYHHSPLNNNDEYNDIVYTVYLANMFCGIEERKYSYYYIEEAILEKFNLFDEHKFNDFHERLKGEYRELNVK